MTLNEAYDKINGKYVKNEANYYHYICYEKFHNMINKKDRQELVRRDSNGNIIKDPILPSGSYPATTYDYGKKYVEENEKGKNELCVVRSDRRPELVKHLSLSGSDGDIKIIFNEDNVKNKFGKPKPIDEYQVHSNALINRMIVKWRKNNIRWPAPIVEKMFKDLSNNFYKWDKETTENKIRKLKMHVAIPKDDINDIKYAQDEYHFKPEHMEERIQTKDGYMPFTNKYIKEVMIPTYMKEKVKEDLKVLDQLNIKYTFYECKYPKEHI